MTTATADQCLAGKVAVVTGAGSGLGLAISRCLAGKGARIVLVGRRASALEAAASELGAFAIAVSHDITELAKAGELVASIERKAGSLDILVNNAGTHLRKPAAQTTDSEFSSIFRTHVEAPFALAREASQTMIRRGEGSIVFVSSMAALFGVPEVAAYGAAKAAVLGLMRCLAVEWSASGIRVNAVVPGWIDSGMARATLEKDPDRKSRILTRTPLHRLGSPEDIAEAVAYLCSPAATFVTGTQLVVDGGAAIGF